MGARVGDLPQVPVSAYAVAPQQATEALKTVRRHSRDLDEYQQFIEALGLDEGQD